MGLAGRPVMRVVWLGSPGIMPQVTQHSSKMTTAQLTSSTQFSLKLLREINLGSQKLYLMSRNMHKWLGLKLKM